MRPKFETGNKVRLNGSTPLWIANGNHPTGEVKAITHRGERRIYWLKLRDKGKGYPISCDLRSYQIDPLVVLPNGRPSKSTLRRYHRKVKRVLRYSSGRKVAACDMLVRENQGLGAYKGYCIKEAERCRK